MNGRHGIRFGVTQLNAYLPLEFSITASNVLNASTETELNPQNFC